MILKYYQSLDLPFDSGHMPGDRKRHHNANKKKKKVKFAGCHRPSWSCLLEVFSLPGISRQLMRVSIVKLKLAYQEF